MYMYIYNRHNRNPVDLFTNVGINIKVYLWHLKTQYVWLKNIAPQKPGIQVQYIDDV